MLGVWLQHPVRRYETVMSELGASEVLARLRDAGFSLIPEAPDSFELRRRADPEAPPLAMRVSVRRTGTELQLYIRHPKPAGVRRLGPWLGAFFGGAGLGAAVMVVTGVEELAHFGVLGGAVLGAMCFDDARHPVEVPKAQRPAARRLFGRVRDAVGGSTGDDTYRL